MVDGQAAVVIFFVLSGFVLALPAAAGKPMPYLPFLAKRMCRVYLPFALVTLAVAAAVALVPTHHRDDVSTWINMLRVIPGEVSLYGHLLMTGEGRDMVLNPVMWTLVHEMRISLVLPLLFLAFRRFGVLPSVLATFGLSAAASFGLQDSISGSWQASLHFVWMFAAGSAMAFYFPALKGWAAQLSRPTSRLMWVVALLLLAAPFNRVYGDFIVGAGAGLLIVLSSALTMAPASLGARAPLWLGKVSYSLYLIHLPILTLGMMSGALSAPWLLLLTLPLAALVNRAVEGPCQTLGIRSAAAAGKLTLPNALDAVLQPLTWSARTAGLRVVSAE